MKTSERLHKIVTDLSEIEKDVAIMEHRLSLIGGVIENNERRHGPLEGVAAEIDCILRDKEYCEECCMCKSDCSCPKDMSHDVEFNRQGWEPETPNEDSK
jgi:hypothetical protein